MKKVFIGLGAVLALAVAALLALPSLIDWNDYREEVSAQIAAVTGREVAFDGALDLTLLPAPTLSAECVSL